MEDVFAVREEIAAAITEALRVALVAGGSRQPAQSTARAMRPRTILYLQGRERYKPLRSQDLVEALRTVPPGDADRRVIRAGVGGNGGLWAVPPVAWTATRQEFNGSGSRRRATRSR